MRRSTRQRKREEDTVGVSDDEARDVRPPPAKKKKARRVHTKALPTSIDDGIVGVDGNAASGTTSAKSPTWVYSRFAKEQRTQWDDLLRTQCLARVGADFYDLFELASAISEDNPLDAFVDSLGIRLCGPFDLLAHACSHAKEISFDKPLFLHGRFFLDPPEVTTVLKSVSDDNAGAHWGYFRDAPEQTPEYIVHAEDSSKCVFTVAGSSLFHVFDAKITELSNKSAGFKDLAAKVKQYLHFKYPAGATPSSLSRKRSSQATAPSLHQLGIVVPYDGKKETGFRELPVTGEQLESLIAQIRDGSSPNARKTLSGLITRATIANDECDFGTGLLLGLDLFTAGTALEKESLQLLRVAYMLLRRMDFYKIAAAHATHRRSTASAVTEDDALTSRLRAPPIDCIVTRLPEASTDTSAEASHVSGVPMPAPKISSLTFP